MAPARIEDLLRELAPQVLAALVRRYGYGQFHLCEDASQEALLAAALQWPREGTPDNPRGWLVTVASRRLTDQVRSEQSRRTREELIAVATPHSELLGPPADAEPADRDDSLALLFGCWLITSVCSSTGGPVGSVTSSRKPASWPAHGSGRP